MGWRVRLASRVPLPAKVRTAAKGRTSNALCASLRWWCPHLTRCRPRAGATFTRRFRTQPASFLPSIPRLSKLCLSNGFLPPRQTLPSTLQPSIELTARNNSLARQLLRAISRTAPSKSYHRRPVTASGPASSPKKGTDKIRGRIDLHNTNQHI